MLRSSPMRTQHVEQRAEPLGESERLGVATFRRRRRRLEDFPVEPGPPPAAPCPCGGYDTDCARCELEETTRPDAPERCLLCPAMIPATQLRKHMQTEHDAR